MADNIICGTLTELKATVQEGCNYPYFTDLESEVQRGNIFPWTQENCGRDRSSHVAFIPILSYCVLKCGVNETLS